MATSKITKEAERKLINSLDSILELVADGSSPNDAIVKTARADDLTDNQTQLLIQAYNNAKFNRQRNSSSILAEKVAHFELADPKLVFKDLYPNVKEAAAQADQVTVSTDYLRPPTRFGTPRLMPAPVIEKQASAPQLPKMAKEPEVVMKKAWSLLKELDREYDEHRRLASSARDAVDGAFGDLLGYFKQAWHTPFAEVAANATALFGPKAGIVMKHLVAENPRLEKEASAPLPVILSAVESNKAPYSLLQKCLQKAAEYATLQEKFQNFSKQAGTSSGQLLSHFLPTPAQPQRGSIVKRAEAELTKKANVEQGINTLAPLGQGMIENFSQASKPNSDLEPGSLKEIFPGPTEKLESKSLVNMLDPAHDQKLRQIRSQAVFHDLMANDEFLSGEHPDKVSKLYNEITRMSPRSADQPLMMRALLRQYLAQGQVAPHDIDQLAGIENKLKERDDPKDELHMPGTTPAIGGH